MGFRIGDRVSWTSQAGGRSVLKQGAVYEIVASGAKPTGIKRAGMPRDHESYVVKASKTTDRKRTARYWPLVHRLHKSFDIFNEQTLREEIVRTWGQAGSHIDAYDRLLKVNERLSKLLAEQPYENSALTVVQIQRAVYEGIPAPVPASQQWPGHTGEAG